MRRKKRIVKYLFLYFIIGVTCSENWLCLGDGESETETPLIIFEEEDKDEKAQSYYLYLKASYQQAKGSHAQALKTYQRLFLYPHVTQVYEGFLNLLFDTGQFDTIAKLESQKKEEFKKFFTDNLAIKLIFAQAYLYLGQDVKAEKLFSELIERYPDNEQVAYYSAVSYLKNNQIDKALVFLKKCLKRPALKSRYFLFHFLESKIYMQKNNHAQALAAIEKSLQLFPRFDQGLLFKSMLLEQMGKVNEAISGYKNFLDVVGRDAVVEKQLVQLCFSQKRFKEAELYIERIKNDSAEYYFDRALIAFRSKDYEQALQHITLVLQKDNQFSKAKLLKIDILLALERIEEVLVFMADWLVREPENNSVLHTFLLLKKANISLERLMATLQAVLKKKQSMGILAVLADLYLEKKDYKNSLRYYQKIIPLAKTNVSRSQVLFQMGLCCFMLRQAQQTEKVLKKVLAYQPAHSSACNLLAYYYASLGKNLPEALELVNKALAAEPGRHDFLDTKGVIFLKLGKKEESIKVLEEAQKRAPFDKVIKKHLNEAKKLHHE